MSDEAQTTGRRHGAAHVRQLWEEGKRHQVVWIAHGGCLVPTGGILHSPAYLDDYEQGARQAAKSILEEVPEHLIEKAFATTRECAEVGHTSYATLHDLPPALVVRHSEPQELYRAHSAHNDRWYLVGRKLHEAPTTPAAQATLTMFSTDLDDDAFDYLPTQEEHDAGAIARLGEAAGQGGKIDYQGEVLRGGKRMSPA